MPRGRSKSTNKNDNAKQKKSPPNEVHNKTASSDIQPTDASVKLPASRPVRQRKIKEINYAALLEDDDDIREEEADNDFIDGLGSISSSSEALEVPEAEVEALVPKKRGKGRPAKKDLPGNNISGSDTIFFRLLTIHF
jgi:hypothetical protein